MKSTNTNEIQTTGDQPVAIKSAGPPRQRVLCLAMAALAGFATSAQAAIPVGASGSGTLTFDSAPAATEWSMLSVSGAAGDVTTDAGLDSAMISIVASGITGPLATQAGSGTNGSAYWRSGDQKLGTQPTGNKMTLLMATLQNTSGDTINGLTVAYTLGLPTVNPAEEIKGHRVYWSNTGATGSWTAAGDNLLTATGTTPISMDLTSLAWGDGETLYLLWADDNGSNPDGDYTIDDVSFTKTAAQAKILTFGLPGMPSVIAGTSITMYVPTGTNVTSLGPDFTLSDGATCYQTDPRLPPPPAVVINPFDSFDFTSPLHYWVRSSDGLVTNDYTVTVTESPVETTVIWNTGSGAWDTSSVNWLGEVFGLPAAFSDGQNVIFNRTEGGTITIAADMLPASTTVSASSGTYTFNGGPIGAGALTKSGGGDLTLSNAHSYPGGTTLRGGGLLSLANGAAIGTGTLTLDNVGTTANITISSYPSGTLTNNNAIDLWTTLRSHNGFNSGTGPITIHSAGLQIRNSVTLGGVISGPGGLNAFDLIYGVDGGIGAGGEFKGDITLRDSQTVRIDGWGPMWSALTISGIVDDGGNGYGLNVTSNSGAARLFLTRPNTFSGDTTVAAATPNNYIGVGIGHNLALQNSALVVNRQYTAMIGSGVTTPTIGGLKGTEALASACAAASFAWADSYYSNVTALTLNLAAGKTCTYSGAIADGATGMAVIKNGDGTQELGGANTYTGNTLVNAGQLTLTDTGSMAFKLTNSSSNALTGTGTVVLNGAFAFDRTAVSVTSGTWTIVDVGTLGVTYGPTFGVTGFDKVGGVWSKSGWVFDPATGMLTYAPTALITSFSYTDGSGTYTGVIDQIAKTISLGPLPSSTSLATLNPSFTLNSGTCNRTSGSPPSPTFAAQNPATYTVTDGGVVNDYIVTVYVAPVPPYGLSGLDMWLDASAPYSISLAGSAVTEWRDARGLSGKATTRAGTPTVATGIGGLPTIHFNTSSWMNDGVNRAAGPVTILYVSRQTGGTNARVLSATSNNWLMGYHGNQYSRFYFEGWVYEAGPSSNTNPHLFAATIGGSGQPSTVYSDGTLLVSNTNGTQGPNNLQLNGYSSGSEPSDCDISEIMVYNRVLSATELNAVGSYLATKYALTTNYPGSGEIVSFGIPGSSGVIDRTAKTIALTVPYTPWNAGLSSLAPTFALTSGTCDQTSGSPPSPDFGALNPATYTVTDGAIVNAYTVTVTVAAPRTGKDMSNVLFAGSGYGPAHPANTNNVGTDWVLQVRSGTSRNPLSPTYVMSSGATGNPASGSPLDFSGVPQPYRISAEDETYQDYAVVVKEWAGYAARVMTSNPYAYWPLNEGKGLVAYDNTAGINAAYSSAGITYSVAGPAVLSGDDTAISTDGTGTNAVRIPHNAALCPDGPFSVEMWVKPFSVPPPSSPRYIASNCRISGDREGWYMAQDAGGTFGTGTNSIVVRLFKRSGTNNTQVWVPIDTVKWYHIALTYDGTKARLYKDGVCEDVENKGWANVAAYFGSTHPDPFTIGVRSDSNFPWPGSAAGVAFFTRSLTAEEILSHATAPPTLSYADWAATKYPTADLTDPTADLDRDGMSNFGEYAFGLDPTTGSSVNPNTAPLDKGTHKFRYTRTENTGLSYTVWTSADLQAWNGPATVTETVVGTPSEGVETVEVTLTAPPAGDELFVRVQAE